MKDFQGKIAVLTGGGTGMGRELVRQLVSEGCSIAMCDLSSASMEETQRLCERDRLPQGTRISRHVVDVSDEPQVLRFRDEVAREHGSEVHLLFNNAGISGGGSLITDPREQWERTFNVCWGGVYLCTRAFLPLLMRASEAHIVNTSSVNGFWASIGPHIPHTAYSAAKFAVKGFTEALIADLKANAPHIKCSLVMPGHIGTSIVSNSRRIQSGAEGPTASEIAQARRRLTAAGRDVAQLSDAAIAALITERARRFLEEAPTTAAAAVQEILAGVKAERWRILVGRDAHRLDELVRQDPEHAYEVEFFTNFANEVGWRLGH
jgi:NAD(P)-dependent dehydrogenase (short-subunit alcohol dehydrogenase family)